MAANTVTPSGALLKAVMLGGAASITGFEADSGLPVDPTPSFRQGFGRVFLGNSLYLAGTQRSQPLSVVDRVAVQQGDTHEYCVRANGGPLTITLVWTDYPALPSGAGECVGRGEGAGRAQRGGRLPLPRHRVPTPSPPRTHTPALPAAQKALVHDLDLTVRAAGLNGIPLLGNGGSAEDPSTPDRCVGVWGWTSAVVGCQMWAGQRAAYCRGAAACPWALPCGPQPPLPTPFPALTCPQGEQRGAGEPGQPTARPRGHHCARVCHL